METEAQRLLLLGGLPGPEQLAALREQGRRRLVNLCGVDLRDIYGPATLGPFQVSHHIFADVFSQGIPATGEEAWTAIDVNLYLSQADRHFERQQLLGAIKAVQTALAAKQPVFVFCNQGEGRSPLVAIAALFRLDDTSLADTVRTVKALRPRTRFTHTSLAALRWSHERAKGGRPHGF